MVPAHERFHSHELKATNVNLRLVVHNKLRVLETRSYVAFEHKLFEGARSAACSVKVKIVAALHLRSIECNARCLQQSGSITTVMWIHADPNTARHEDLLIVEDKCLVECLLDGARDVGSVLRAWNLCEQHCELIPTETRHGIAFANTTRESLGH